MNTQLLLTFTTSIQLTDTIRSIEDCYDIAFNSIFVLQNREQQLEFFCTYNVYNETIPDSTPSKTISVHRKKHTNTLYTINALNEVVKYLNGGQEDRSFPIDWNNFKNTLLVTNADGLRIIPTRLFEKIEIGS